jgi:hypothetical protein
MSLWHWLIVIAIGVGGAAALYGLHRLCLWLEARGWLYYLHKKPDSSPASCLVAFQQAIEPQTKHVLHLREQRRQRSDGEAPGENDPPKAEPS